MRYNPYIWSLGSIVSATKSSHICGFACEKQRENISKVQSIPTSLPVRLVRRRGRWRGERRRRGATRGAFQLQREMRQLRLVGGRRGLKGETEVAHLMLLLLRLLWLLLLLHFVFSVVDLVAVVDVCDDGRLGHVHGGVVVDQVAADNVALLLLLLRLLLLLLLCAALAAVSCSGLAVEVEKGLSEIFHYNFSLH